MLKSFRISNFKNLVNLSFEPSGLNLLVGSNNSGKTSLCHALRFLSLTAKMPLQDAAAASTAEPWNLLNVYISSRSTEIKAVCQLQMEDDCLTFTYELTLAYEKSPDRKVAQPSFAVVKERLRVTGGGLEDATLLNNDAGHVRLLHEMRYLRGDRYGPEVYVETNAPTDATMLCRLYDLETNKRSNAFKRYLTTWGYYNFDPAHLRDNQVRPLDSDLAGSGSNLASALFNLHNARPRVERKLIEAIRVLEPRLDVFSFQSPDPEHVYMFFEDRRENRFGLDNVSDGTLRYLAMFLVVLGGRANMEERIGSPVIMIEEPENGIFVGHLKNMIESVDPSGAGGQFIFTSHNPYFIDLFDSSLGGVFLIKAGETHSTLVRSDPALLHERLEKFSLGEMHFRGLLE